MTPKEVKQIELISANVDYLLEQRNWSWNRLATETGVAQATISRLKNAKFEPSFFTIQRIADKLNTSMEWLCQHHDRKHLSAAG